MPNKNRKARPTPAATAAPERVRPRRTWLAVLVGALLLATLGAWIWVEQDSGAKLPAGHPPIAEGKAAAAAQTPTASAPVLVDEQQCQGCHQAQTKDWQGSHHQQAMKPASEGHVLGDFDNVTFKGDTETTRFFRKDGEYWVNTPGADGKPADFKVAYTFGFEPLQQYLIDYPDKTGGPGGRLQALGVAWDSRKHRWFQLMPGQRIDFKDELHWTRPAQNANFMCIECHTTGFKRNYDAQTDSFASHWNSLGVGCQACHGPASRHLEWAQKPDRSQDKGFEVPLQNASQATIVETCARCHARRAPLADGFQNDHRFMDDYLPSTLTRELYEIDGKIKDEVFEWGSFTQSRMFAKGVQCTDCHNPHSGELKAPGNGVCLQCHNTAGKAVRPQIDGKGLQAKNYDSPEHTHHQPGTPGAQCTSCHMPGRYYMVNDYRHDHGFTLPNPQHARRIGAPDACQACHRDMPAKQLGSTFRDWFANELPARANASSNPAPRYDDTLSKARNGQPGASRALHLLLATPDLPAIRRATLLAELPSYPSPRSLELVALGLRDSDPLVRNTAVEALAPLAAPAQQLALLLPLLDDPIRAVRIAAAWQLAQLPPPVRAGIAGPLQRGLAEYEQVQHDLAERAEANLNLAQLYQLTGRDEQVEPALRDAIQRNPDFLPAKVTLIQWLEANDRTGEARQLLDESLRLHAGSGLLHHVNGLALVRAGQRPQALRELREAVRLSPDDDQFRYVLAIALHDSGDSDGACHELEQLLQRHPANRAARLALLDYLRETGQFQKVQQLTAELEQQNPDDPALKRE
ncbi:putative CXXCH cytochrome family protein [Pseudomonas nitritireducens]|uniref:Putative CXXCH cytochrome family protein n=1 Tax=Pseudomonas nitroreducens TaxID=46680 RepID=A0A7W7KK91_PSENT|nr:tetratricopeptide repeat protein [Pseudomonas nitritireducens]MBB4864370.1 putative CXXCH cytochrome family protein [Pseudomonas nitritireducens]